MEKLRAKVAQKIAAKFEARVEEIDVIKIYPIGPLASEVIDKWIREVKTPREWQVESAVLTDTIKKLQEISWAFTKLKIELEKRAYERARQMILELSEMIFKTPGREKVREKEEEGEKK